MVCSTYTEFKDFMIHGFKIQFCFLNWKLKILFLLNIVCVLLAVLLIWIEFIICLMLFILHHLMVLGFFFINTWHNGLEIAIFFTAGTIRMVILRIFMQCLTWYLEGCAFVIYLYQALFFEHGIFMRCVFLHVFP